MSFHGNQILRNIFKKYSYKMMQFGKLRKFIDTKTRILVYKQTILPLVEYVSYMLYLNRRCDIEKLQRLQNRCLRMCLDVKRPIDMSIVDIHRTARIDTLDDRRLNQLVKIMFSLVQKNMYKKEGLHVTRTMNTFIFDTQIVHSCIYANCPYYMGVQFWWILNPLETNRHSIRNLRVSEHITRRY